MNTYNINGRMAFNKEGCIELFKKEYNNDKRRVKDDLYLTDLFTVQEVALLIDIEKKKESVVLVEIRANEITLDSWYINKGQEQNEIRELMDNGKEIYKGCCVYIGKRLYETL